MKTIRLKSNRSILAASLGLALLSLGLSAATAAENWVAYPASPTGSKIVIAGTSTIHDWTMETTLVSGKMELEENFKLDGLKPGKVPARATVNMTVRSFKSGKVGMDEVMQQAMKFEKFPKIEFILGELTFKEGPKGTDGLYQFDAKGDLIVAGVTNKVSMPITFLQVSPIRYKVSGSVPLKMTDYGVVPPAPKLALGAIKTGDEIKITFDWVAAQRAPAKP